MSTTTRTTVGNPNNTSTTTLGTTTFGTSTLGTTLTTVNDTASIVPNTTETASTPQTTTTTTTIRVTSATTLLSASFCPELNGGYSKSQSTTVNKNHILSTTQRNVGTVVKVQCPTTDFGIEPTYLLCQTNGYWNSTLPHCNEFFEFSSYKLFFAIGGTALGLIVVVLSIIYCSLLKCNKKNSSRHSDNSDTIDVKQVDPYHIGERLYAQPSSSGESSPANSSISKPTVFSTHINPSFYEDAYDRWKKQDDTERLYDSPWPKQRGLKAQSETENFKWSQSSLKTLGDTGFQKLPRAFVSLDHISFSSEDSISLDSTTKSVDPLYPAKSNSPGQTLNGVKRYRRMRSRELDSNTLSSKLNTSTFDAKNGPLDGKNDFRLADGNPTMGVTNL